MLKKRAIARQIIELGGKPLKFKTFSLSCFSFSVLSVLSLLSFSAKTDSNLVRRRREREILIFELWLGQTLWKQEK